MTGELSYREAVRDAMAEEMRRDETVLLLGEDVGPAGGVFKTSVGLHEEFGDHRVMDMPIAENAFVGAALGMAITGMRPIVEIMFSDFLGVCADQIANSIAKYRYISAGSVAVPLVIRSIGGGGLGFGPQHAQTGESWFQVFPGLKIVAASNPADAYMMMKAAIRDDNPVLFIEHRALYGQKGSVVRADDPPPLGAARIVKPGRHVTVVASLMMVGRAIAAADLLIEQGIELEVVDLRSLRPLDDSTIIESVQKTGRLLTVEEQPVLGGWGADVVAAVVGDAFDYLDAPPQRIGLPDAPLPFSPVLEDAALPSSRSIAEVALALSRGNRAPHQRVPDLQR
jgi:pyruvate dehydrogenase E1 component beta subunit